MSNSRYKVAIVQSGQLDGRTGSHGETFCLFLRDLQDHQNSSWEWYHTAQKARARADVLVQELKDGLDVRLREHEGK